MTQIDLQSFGFIIGTIITVVVNLENALEIWYWTKFYHGALWITIIVYFLFHVAAYSTIVSKIFRINYNYVGVAQAVLLSGRFWLILVLNCTILLLPVYCREFYRMRFQPNEIDKARINQKYRHEEKAEFLTDIRQKVHLKKHLARSSYAFAQEKGWGPLITSGRMQIRPNPYSRTSHDLGYLDFINYPRFECKFMLKRIWNLEYCKVLYPYKNNDLIARTLNSYLEAVRKAIWKSNGGKESVVDGIWLDFTSNIQSPHIDHL
ncbi:unnamed protein product [Rotaria sp. Silwood1]|nr:unnamed protein product [Rotaria sp. Silwood1]